MEVIFFLSEKAILKCTKAMDRRVLSLQASENYREVTEAQLWSSQEDSDGAYLGLNFMQKLASVGGLRTDPPWNLRLHL